MIGDGIIRLGTPLRDAAVAPAPDDFLEPTNAGVPGKLGNPHGSHVVNPEIVDERQLRSGRWPRTFSTAVGDEGCPAAC